MLTLARLFGLIAAAGTPLRAPATAAQKTTVSNAAVPSIVVIELQGRGWLNTLRRAAGLTLAAAMQIKQRRAQNYCVIKIVMATYSYKSLAQHDRNSEISLKHFRIKKPED